MRDIYSNSQDCERMLELGLQVHGCMQSYKNLVDQGQASKQDCKALELQRSLGVLELKRSGRVYPQEFTSRGWA